MNIALGLKTKITVLIAVLLTAFTVAIALYNIKTQETVTRQRLLDKAIAMTSLLSAGAADALARGEILDVKFLLTDVLAQNDVRYVYVFDPAGRILTDGTTENPHHLQTLDDPVSLRAVAVDSLMMQFRDDVLDVSKIIAVNRQKFGGVRIGFSLSTMHAEILALKHWNIGLGIGFIVLGTVLSICLVGRLVRPLKQLTEATKAVSWGDMNRHINVHTTDEMHALAEAFNQMTENLKLSQAALISTRDYTENILRSMTDALFVMNPEGEIERVNAALCDLLGYGENELIGRPAEAIFAPGEGAFFDGQVVAHLLQTGTVRNVEKHLLGKGGKKVTVLLSGAVVKNAEGEALGVVCAARDITDRLAAEMALRESEARFRRLSESAFEGIFIHRGGIILDANDQFAQMLGFSKGAELIGMNGWRFVGRNSRRVAIEHIRADDERPFEATICPKNGDEFPIEVVGRRVPYAGKPVGVVALRDIRERKQAEAERHGLERQLVQSERLAAVGTVAAGIVHNLKNPLTGILGYAELMKIKYPDIVETDRILASAENMRVMIENILAKSRQKKTREQVDLNQLLRRELDFLQADRLFRREVKTEVNLSAHLPLITGVYSDFSQVFGNLLRNAVEAMMCDCPEKVLRVSTIHSQDNSIQVEIRDTGCGIEKENLPNLFKPFFTTKTDKDGPQGTGLGLYMTLQLLTAYGATIDVKSEVGKGALFRVCIPLKSTGESE